jgi:hypothetical protein
MEKFFLEKQAEMPMSLNEKRAGKQGNMLNTEAQYIVLLMKNLKPRLTTNFQAQ